MISEEIVNAATFFERCGHMSRDVNGDEYERGRAVLSATSEFQAWAATPEFKAASVIQEESSAAQRAASEAWCIAQLTPQAQAYAALLRAAKEQYKNG